MRWSAEHRSRDQDQCEPVEQVPDAHHPLIVGPDAFGNAHSEERRQERGKHVAAERQDHPRSPRPVGGIDDDQDLYGIEVYPNPTNDIVKVRTLRPIDWPLKIFMVDMYGQIVKDYRMNHLVGEIALDLSDLANGMYIMNIEVENGRKHIVRIVIE